MVGALHELLVLLEISYVAGEIRGRRLDVALGSPTSFSLFSKVPPPMVTRRGAGIHGCSRNRIGAHIYSSLAQIEAWLSEEQPPPRGRPKPHSSSWPRHDDETPRVLEHSPHPYIILTMWHVGRNWTT